MRRLPHLALFRADATTRLPSLWESELWAGAALRLAGFSSGRGVCARRGRAARQGYWRRRERKDENINRSIISKLMAIITILETRFRHICIIVYNTNNMDNNKIIKRKYKKQKSINNINSDYSIIKYIFYI